MKVSKLFVFFGCVTRLLKVAYVKIREHILVVNPV